ncbi:MAG: hypothetical protein WKG07_06540 [Hymenobacter sp.]
MTSGSTDAATQFLRRSTEAQLMSGLQPRHRQPPSTRWAPAGPTQHHDRPQYNSIR